MASVLGLATLTLMTLGFFLAVPLVLIPVIAGALWYTRRREQGAQTAAETVTVRRGTTVATDGGPVEAARAA